MIDPESTKINIQKSTILNFSPKLLKRTYNFKIDFWRENSYNFDLVTKISVGFYSHRSGLLERMSLRAMLWTTALLPC